MRERRNHEQFAQRHCSWHSSRCSGIEGAAGRTDRGKEDQQDDVSNAHHLSISSRPARTGTLVIGSLLWLAGSLWSAESAVDVLIGYVTNPHVDMEERGVEAAEVVREMWAGMKPVGVYQSAKPVRPMISPAWASWTSIRLSPSK